MNVSHGCIRLYPEDIERLFMKTPIGTPGRFVYQPIKFGWRGDALYVEVHDDLYAVYPGLWNHALHEVARLHLDKYVDMGKLEKAVEAKTGLVTYVMPGAEPDRTMDGIEAASIPPPPETAPVVASTTPTSNDATATTAAPADTMTAVDGNDDNDSIKSSDIAPSDTVSHDGDWEPIPASGGKHSDTVE